MTALNDLLNYLRSMKAEIGDMIPKVREEAQQSTWDAQHAKSAANWQAEVDEVYARGEWEKIYDGQRDKRAEQATTIKDLRDANASLVADNAALSKNILNCQETNRVLADLLANAKATPLSTDSVATIQAEVAKPDRAAKLVEICNLLDKSMVQTACYRILDVLKELP